MFFGYPSNYVNPFEIPRPLYNHEPLISQRKASPLNAWDPFSFTDLRPTSARHRSHNNYHHDPYYNGMVDNVDESPYRIPVSRQHDTARSKKGSTKPSTHSKNSPNRDRANIKINSDPRQEDKNQMPIDGQHSQSVPVRIASPPAKRKASTKILKKDVNLDEIAKKIQKCWRGRAIRSQKLLDKLTFLKKIDGQVDVLQQQYMSWFSLPLDGPINLPPDTQYVGRIPRDLLAFEHELTSKLLNLDAISGGTSDIVRSRRKSIVLKIEDLLQRVDKMRKVFEDREAELQVHNQETKEDAISDDMVDTSSSEAAESSIAETSDMAVEDLNKATDLQHDVGLSIKDIEANNSRQILPLKHMCFKLCDQLINKALAQR